MEERADLSGYRYSYDPDTESTLVSHEESDWWVLCCNAGGVIACDQEYDEEVLEELGYDAESIMDIASDRIDEDDPVSSLGSWTWDEVQGHIVRQSR